MKNPALLDRYVRAKFRIGIAIEFPILIAGGVLGVIFSWASFPLFPLPNIFGLILIVSGYVIHMGYAHKAFKKHSAHAHYRPEGNDKLVTDGIYAKIRHPGYLGLILIYFGLGFIFGIVWMLIPAAVFTVLTCLTALKEERFLKEQFGDEYEDYVRRVPWRFIPKIV